MKRGRPEDIPGAFRPGPEDIPGAFRPGPEDIPGASRPGPRRRREAVWAAGILLAGSLAPAAGPRAGPDEPRSSAGETRSTSEAPAAKSAERGEVEVEWLGGREVVPIPVAERMSLPLSPRRAPGGSPPVELLIGAKRIPLENLISIRFPSRKSAAGEPTLVLFLRDGAEVAGRVVAGDEDSVSLASSSLGPEPIRVPIEKVRGIVVTGASNRPAGAASTAPPTALRPSPGPGTVPSTAPATAPASRAAAGRGSPRSEGAWKIRLRNQIASSRVEKDEVILLQEGRVQGILEALEADGARFSSDTLGDLKIGYEKLRAIILAEVKLPGDGGAEAGAPPGKGGSTPASPILARVTLADGTILPLSAAGIDSGKIAAEHPILGSVTIPLSEVIDITFLGGRSSYLSDREPSSVREHLGPAFVKKMPHQRDASVTGEPLRMAGREYRKGLGVHSYSLLEYDLGGEFSRFQAIIGLDESAQPNEPDSAADDVGQVLFRVRLDGKPLLEKPMAWRDPPVPIDLPVSGGKTLSLEVDFGGPRAGSEEGAAGFNFARDRADWAEARVIR